MTEQQKTRALEILAKLYADQYGIEKYKLTIKKQEGEDV